MRFLRCRKDAIPQLTGKRVAIIGAGPAGLAAAGVLRCKGHTVEVYDMMPEPGGLMIFGIPEYHVPKASVRKGVEELKGADVVFHLNTKVYNSVVPEDGKSLEDLVKDYDAILLSTGTWDSRSLGVPGEDLGKVYKALEWLIEFYNAQLSYTGWDSVPPLGHRGLVIGGGLTAVDSVEVPLRYARDRYGIEKVYLSYRRTRNEAPMSAREFNRLERDLGAETLELTIPVEFIGDDSGMVTEARLQKTRLEPVPEGRPRPVPIPGSEFTIDVDYVLIAAGELATPPFKDGCCGIELNRNGTIKTDDKFRTTRRKVFAAGDVRHGPSLIGPALKGGMDAGAAMHEFLETGEWTG